MADVLSFRLRQRPVRIAAAISTLVVSFFYLLAQMAGAGGLVALLLGIEGALGQRLVIVVVGILMIFYVIYGGMKGTTWVQIIKAVLLIIGAAIMTVWVLGKFGFSLSTLLGEATTASQDAGGKDLLQPGLQYKNPSTSSPLDGARARHGGSAARAHALLHRCRPRARPAARSSGRSAHRHLLPLHPRAGLRGGRARGRQGDQERTRRRQLAAPLLAFELGGEILLGIISAVAFATILAVVAA